MEHLWLWLVDLIMPSLLLAAGVAFRRRAPRCPSREHGYRTARSLSGPRAWRYAQSCFAGLCVRFGEALLALVSADRLRAAVWDLSSPVGLSYLNNSLCALLCLSIVPLVELSLAGRFDDKPPAADGDGHRELSRAA